MFAAKFSREPRRMNIFEKEAANWIEQLTDVRSFKKLAAYVKNAYYVNGDGCIVKGIKKAPTKSLDFYWETGSYRFYATHKLIRESGGHQDGSFREVRHAMELFQKAGAEDNMVFVAIMDGPYFNDTKMNDLNRFSRQQEPKSIALNIGKLSNLLREYSIAHVQLTAGHESNF